MYGNLNLNKIEQAMAAAAARHGKAFHLRHRLIAALPADSRSARKRVRDMLIADDPGEALMKLGDELIAEYGLSDAA